VDGCYLLANVTLEWTLAGRICHAISDDAHLLVINDAAEQMAVARMLDSIDRQCPAFHRSSYRSSVTIVIFISPG